MAFTETYLYMETENPDASTNNKAQAHELLQKFNDSFFKLHLLFLEFVLKKYYIANSSMHKMQTKINISGNSINNLYSEPLKLCIKDSETTEKTL